MDGLLVDYTNVKNMKFISYTYLSLFFISINQGMIPNIIYGVVPGGIVDGYHEGTGAEKVLTS